MKNKLNNEDKKLIHKVQKQISGWKIRFKNSSEDTGKKAVTQMEKKRWDVGRMKEFSVFIV